MSAAAENLFTNLEAALLGAAPVNLATLPAAQPIQSQEDRRAEWLAQRWGKFTASEFHRLMGYPEKNELPKGAKTYAMEKAVELMTECRPDSYVSADMQWGIDHEAEAADEFCRVTGLTLEYHKDGQQFIALDEHVGGTPDGLVREFPAGIEIKCPKSKTHFEYLEVVDGPSLLAVASEYYWQIQGLMLITDRSLWYFVSYDPRFKIEALRLHIAPIQRNEKAIELLRTRVEMARVYRDLIVDRVNVAMQKRSIENE